MTENSLKERENGPESISRYLTVQPNLNEFRKEQLTRQSHTQFISFYPDDSVGSVWQFEQVKCNSDYAHYVILHKQWHWMRQQHCKDADYDASSYIAVRCVGDRHKEIGKD